MRGFFCGVSSKGLFSDQFFVFKKSLRSLPQGERSERSGIMDIPSRRLRAYISL